MSVAETSAFEFVIEMVRRAVPPALTDVGEKLFETDGRVCETPSVSEAVHTPVETTQKVAVFVFTTLAGGAIEAELETCVCACTIPKQTRPKNKKAMLTAFRQASK